MKVKHARFVFAHSGVDLLSGTDNMTMEQLLEMNRALLSIARNPDDPQLIPQDQFDNMEFEDIEKELSSLFLVESGTSGQSSD